MHMIAAKAVASDNAIPNDPEKPMVTSGIRIGSAAATSRGFSMDEYHEIAALKLDTLEAARTETLDTRRPEISDRVRQPVARFPLPN